MSSPAVTTPDTGPAQAAPSRWTRPMLVANLVAQIVIVVTGGAVRLSGSGLGCSTWPECEPGSFTPVWHEATSWHPVIEFGNRTLTGVLAVIAVAVAVLVWRDRSRSTGYRLLGLAPLVGVAVQAVVGGLTVLAELHPAVVGSHMLVSMALIWVSAVLLARSAEGDGAAVPLAPPAVRRLAVAAVAALAVVLALGVVTTGAGPHSGDAEVGYRFAVDPVAASRVHALAVWVFVAVAVTVVVVLHRTGSTAPLRRWYLLLGVTVAQGAIGYVQFLTDLPEVLVGAHMLGAALLVAATAGAVLALRERPAEPVPSAAPSAS